MDGRDKPGHDEVNESVQRAVGIISQPILNIARPVPETEPHDAGAADAWRSRFGMTPGLEQEPNAPLGLVDPILQQACGGNVAMLVA